MAGEVLVNSLTPDQVNSAAPLMGIPRDDERRPGGIDRLAVPLFGNDRTNLLSSGPWGMGKSAVVSLIFHALIVTLLVACFAGTTRKHAETITVFLAGETAPGKSKLSLNEVAHVAAKHAASLVKTQCDTHPERPVAEATKPPVPKAENDHLANRAAATEGSTSSSLPAERPTAPSSTGAIEGQGRQGEAQTGPLYVRANANGRGAETGDGGSDGADGEKRHYLARNFGYIRDMIVKNLKYPYDARRMGWKGSVTVAFMILENGAVADLRVTKGSGHDLLDQSVLRTVRTLQPFPKPPARAELVIPIAFRLE